MVAIDPQPAPPAAPLAAPADAVRRLAALGAARFPGVTISLDALGRDPRIPLAALSDDRLAERYLALACAHGDPAALATLERTYLTPLRAVVLRRLRSEATCDEVMQRVRLHALVARPDRLAAIADFSGAGPLAAWLRITALRIVLRHEHQERRLVPVDPETLADLEALDDPALTALRQRYGDGLELAMRDAFLGAPALDQVLLRLRYTDGHGIDRVAQIAGIHRATAARRLRRAEDHLVAETRRLLGERTGASDSGLDSVLRAIRSQLGLSVRAVFAPGG